jgi:SAM-dependent methyltransferase
MASSEDQGAGRSSGGYEPELFAELAQIEDRSFWFRYRNRLITQTVRDLAEPGDTFLEVGCGTGYVLRGLAEEVGLSVTGSELFADGLKIARRRIPDAELIELDAREMPFESRFDLVGAFDVLEHIDDDVGVIAGMRKAAKPGGYLFLTVPQHPWLWSASDTFAHHVRRYRRQELVAKVEGADLEIVHRTSFVMSLLPFMAAARLRNSNDGASYDLESELVPPLGLNRVFGAALAVECAAIRRGFSLPAGGSLALVARRPRLGPSPG